MRSWVVALACAAVTWGCSGRTPTLEQQLTRDRAAVEARLAAVEGLAATIQRIPPTTRDEVSLAGPPFALIKQLGPPHPAANATFAYAEDLATPSKIALGANSQPEPF